MNTSPPTPRLRDKDLPALFHAADQASKAGQRWYVGALSASLTLSVAAAIFGIGTLADVGEWSSVAAAASFGAGAMITLYLYWGKPERRWYDGRAAAESLKTLAWQWAVGGGSFPKASRDDAETVTDDAFVRRLRDILAGLKNIDIEPDPRDQISMEMRALRGADLSIRRMVYKSDRISDQRRWYTDKARWNRRRSHGWLALVVGVQLGGSALGSLRAAGVLHVDLLGVMAAAAAAAAAWLQVKDHSTLAEAYGVTAQELSLIAAQVDSVDDEDSWSAFVERAEQAISREHVLWRARRGVVSPAELSPGA